MILISYALENLCIKIGVCVQTIYQLLVPPVFRMDIYIDQFSTMLTGGAAIAARRIHKGLRDLGLQSRLWHAGASLDSLEDGLGNEPWATSKILSNGERLGELYRKVTGRLQK